MANNTYHSHRDIPNEFSCFECLSFILLTYNVIDHLANELCVQDMQHVFH